MNFDESAVPEHPAQSAPSCSILIPGLPNDIALTILARLPRSVQALLRGVSRSWKQSMESAAMSTIRTMLDMPGQVWFIFWPDTTMPDGSLFALVDPFSGCCSRVSCPPHLCAHRSHFNFSVCGIVGHEVLILMEPREQSTPLELARELQGVYSFDAACMKWNNAKLAFLDPASTQILRVWGADMEEGYLYAETCDLRVKRMDVKTQMWETLPRPDVWRFDYWGAMLQNRFCMAGGSDTAYCCYPYACSLPVEVWNPMDRTWIRLPELDAEYWAFECMCKYMCPFDRHAVLNDQLYILAARECGGPEVMWYETSSQRWISLGAVPGSYTLQSHLMLLAVGQELWVHNLLPDLSPATSTMMIMAAQPFLSEHLSWKILLKQPKLANGFSKYVGEMLFT